MMLRKSERRLDLIASGGHGKRVEVIPSDGELLLTLSERFSAEVPNSADKDAVLRVFHHNPEAFLTFRNKSTGAIGFIAILPLNKAGTIALADGRLSTIDPQTDFLCQQNRRPNSIYIWAIGINHSTAGGIAHGMRLMESRKYANVPLYCRPANEKAERLFLTLGFAQGAMIGGYWHDDLMVFTHSEDIEDSSGSDQQSHEQRPAYDSFPAADAEPGAIGLKVVHTIEELSQVFMIRGAAYIGEQAIPWSEDVDGNDFCAAHLIGYVGREPAACLRLRFFSNFVKLERLAVLPHFRKTPIATRIVRAGIDYARAKGYCRFYGQTERHVFPIWKRFGFVLRPGDGINYQTDRTYVEGDMITDPVAEPITPYSGEYILLKPEGQWHRDDALFSAEIGA